MALKSSISGRPPQRFHSVAGRNNSNGSAEPQAGDRLRGLKDLAFTLLSEVQALEHEELIAELHAPAEARGLEIEKGIKLDEVLRQFETNIIRQALIITNGNQAHAARLLGLKPNTLNYKVKLYNLA